jgi:hypothetical protein
LRLYCQLFDECAEQVIDAAAESEDQAAAAQQAQDYLSDIESILRTAAAAVNDYSQQSDLRLHILHLESELQVGC